MGKKNKKSNKTQDKELPSTNVVDVEPEDDFDTNPDTVEMPKKKNRKRNVNCTLVEDLPMQINTEINEKDALENHTNVKFKKEKKKKHTKLHEEEPCEEVQNDMDFNKLNKNQVDEPKKKKKKGKLLDEENKQTLETSVKLEHHKQRKNKEKKNKNNLINEASLDNEETNETQNDDANPKKKKPNKKAKTGAPVLNSEEAQVTEEDIDRFIDELDEEDNKQYEDWVKLLDARLSKKERTA